MKLIYLPILLGVISVVVISGCTQSSPDLTPNTNTNIPEMPVKEQPNIREAIKSKIDSFGGTGLPKATSILYQDDELYVEYTTWDINGGQASVFDEMQQLVGLIANVFENEEKPTKLTMKALPADSGTEETYSTTLTWDEAGKMANLELSYTSWQDLTVHITN